MRLSSLWAGMIIESLCIVFLRMWRFKSAEYRPHNREGIKHYLYKRQPIQNLMNVLYKKDNEFGRFFYSPMYVALKNFLFNYRLRKTMVSDCFLRFFPHVATDKNVQIVDIGSGISPITPLPARTLFIDIEDEAIKFLRSRGLNAITGDITDIPLPDSSVDLIFCSEVLEHIPDYKAALKDISRILKINGGVIITVPVHMSYWMDDDGFVGHFRRFNPSSLVREIESSGLKVILQKPIGNWLERKLSWLAIRLARRNIQAMTNQKEVAKLQLWLFYLANLPIFHLLRAIRFLNTNRRSSVMLFAAIK